MVNSGRSFVAAAALLLGGRLVVAPNPNPSPTPGNGATLDGCDKQANCLDLTITRTATNACNLDGAECTVQACMTLNFGKASCPKTETDTLSHACDTSQPNGCPYSNSGDRNFETGEQSPAENGFKQCQIGRLGETLKFLYKDGSACTAATQTYDLDGNIGTIEECRPENAADQTCTSSPGECIWTVTLPSTCPPCENGDSVCNDPHMTGLRGQDIAWAGVDGGWYCLLSDSMSEQQVNVRPTAREQHIQWRQLITGFSVVSEGHTLVVEVLDPYSTTTAGCPLDTHPCLADGALRVLLDGKEIPELIGPVNRMSLPGGITLSSTNLPLECQHFNRARIAQLKQVHAATESRKLRANSFEELLLKFEETVPSDWCSKYITTYGIGDVQSSYAVFWVETPSVSVRTSLGINHQYPGLVTWDGHVLEELDMWQMNIGVEGVPRDQDSLSGLLGETARPTLDENGKVVMTGLGAMRGTIEDYRVAGPEATDFPMLHKSL